VLPSRPSGNRQVRRHDPKDDLRQRNRAVGALFIAIGAAEVSGSAGWTDTFRPSAWRQLCAFGAWLTAVTIPACRRMTTCIATRTGEHRPSARTIGADRRLARYAELAAVKLSLNGATLVFEPELHEHAALIISTECWKQGRLRRCWWPRSTHARGSGEQGSRTTRLHRGGYAPSAPDA
jgi:hypothetical protein